MSAKTAIKCIRCGARGRVRVSGHGPGSKTYEDRACGAIFTEEALSASVEAERARFSGL